METTSHVSQLQPRLLKCGINGSCYKKQNTTAVCHGDPGYIMTYWARLGEFSKRPLTVCQGQVKAWSHKIRTSWGWLAEQQPSWKADRAYGRCQVQSEPAVQPHGMWAKWWTRLLQELGRVVIHSAWHWWGCPWHRGVQLQPAPSQFKRKSWKLKRKALGNAWDAAAVWGQSTHRVWEFGWIQSHLISVSFTVSHPNQQTLPLA